MVGEAATRLVPPTLGAATTLQHPLSSAADESWLESLFPVDVVVDLHPHPLVVCKFATGSHMCRKCNRIVYARGRRCTRPECAPVASPRRATSGSPLMLVSPLSPHSPLGLNVATGVSRRRGSTVDAAQLVNGSAQTTPPNGSFGVSTGSGRLRQQQQQGLLSTNSSIAATPSGRMSTPPLQADASGSAFSALVAGSSGSRRANGATNRFGSVGRGGRSSASPTGRGKSPRAAAAAGTGGSVGGLDMFFCDACFDAGRRFQQLCLASCAGGPRAALAIAALEGVKSGVLAQEPLPVGPEGGRQLSAAAVMAAAAAAAATGSRKSSRAGTPTGVLGRRASEFASRVRSASVAAAAAAVGGVSGTSPATNLSMAGANSVGGALILTVPPLNCDVDTGASGGGTTTGAAANSNFSFGSPPQLHLAGLPLSAQNGGTVGSAKGQGHHAASGSARSNDSSSARGNNRTIPAFSFGTTPRGIDQRVTSARGGAGHDGPLGVIATGYQNGGADGGNGGTDLTSEALLDAAAAGATTRVRELLDLTKFLRTVDIEDIATAGPHRGKTALILGAEHGHHGVVALLLERGAVSESVDARGMTPLMLAAYNGHIAAVETLIAHGAVQHRAALCGYTALHFACTRGHEMVVHRLVCADAPINARTPNGRTPLIIAALNGHTQTVMTLLRRSDCDVAARDHEGYSALDAAVARGHRAAEVVLLEATQRQ